jgi:tetratricopeptide (TPR) repeat protein
MFCGCIYAQETKEAKEAEGAEEVEIDFDALFDEMSMDVKSEVEVLLEELDSADPKVRSRAAGDLSIMVLMGKHGFQDTIKAYPKLVKLLDDRDMNVVDGSISALGQIGYMYYKKNGPAGSEPVIRKIASFLGSEDKELRETAINALSDLDDYAGPAVPAIIKAIDYEGIKAIKENDRFEYMKAEKFLYFDLLGEIGVDAYSAVPTLEKILVLRGIQGFKYMLGKLVFDLHCAKADDYAGHGEHAKALGCLDRALQIGQQPQAFLSRSRVYLKMGNKSKSLADLEKSIAICDTAFPGLKKKLTNAYEEGQRLENLMLLQEVYAEANYFLAAEFHHKDGDNAKALACLSAALREHTGHIASYRLRTDIYISQKEWQKAEADLDFLQHLAPDDADVFMKSGMVNTQLGEDKEAVDSYLRVANVLNKDSVEAWQCLRKFYVKYKMEKDIKICDDKIAEIKSR